MKPGVQWAAPTQIVLHWRVPQVCFATSDRNNFKRCARFHFGRSGRGQPSYCPVQMKLRARRTCTSSHTKFCSDLRFVWIPPALRAEAQAAVA